VITNEGAEYEELTSKRSTEWISVISRSDTGYKNVLESERVCGKHFVFGEPSLVWVPTLNVGKKKYVEKDFKQVAEKAERAKKRRQYAIERAELEAAEKRKRLNISGLRIAEVNFNNSAEPCSSVFEASSTELIEGQAGQDQAEASTEAVEFNPYLEASVATEAKSDVFTEITDQNITPSHDASCQAEQFGYIFHQRGYKARTTRYNFIQVCLLSKF